MNMMASLQAQIGDSLRNGAETATAYAERILARLDALVAATNALAITESERVFVTVSVAAGSVERIDPRAGYMNTIEHVSIVAEGATDIDIYVGSEGSEGFRTRLAAAGADPVPGGLVGYKVPEGSPIFAKAGAAGARVNLQIKRERVY